MFGTRYAIFGLPNLENFESLVAALEFPVGIAIPVNFSSCQKPGCFQMTCDFDVL